MQGGVRGAGGRPAGAGGRAAGALLAALVAAAGCATPAEFVRAVDAGHDAVTRGICDIVDATDRAFGEPRVEDRERIVRLRIGPAVEVRENVGADLTVPVSIRAPLPALERRANIFLQLDSQADTLAERGDTTAAIEEATSLTATILTRVADAVDTGLRLDLFWSDGSPQTGVRPFLRWEARGDGRRFLLEQQAYLNSDVGFGVRSVVQADRVLDADAFVRLRGSWEANAEDEGITQEYVVIYRRPFPRPNLALSVELGVKYNRFDGDPGTGETGPQADPDERFLRARVTGRLWRPWLEYEITPALHVPWRHEDPREWGVTVSLRLLYEDFLRRGGGADAPAAPPPAGDPAAPPRDLAPEGGEGGPGSGLGEDGHVGEPAGAGEGHEEPVDAEGVPGAGGDP